MGGNYIKIDRGILEWEWYKNTNTKTLFIHCLLKANWKDGRFEGVEVKRGSFVTSIANLSEGTSLTTREVRTALEHLKKTGELTIKRHSKFSLITVNNYSEYQNTDNQLTINRQSIDRQTTEERQASDKQATTIEEYKEYKEREEKKEKIINSPQQRTRKTIPPTVEEVKAYCKERGNGIDAENFWDFYQSKNWMVGKSKMKDWQASVRTWERQRGFKPEEPKAEPKPRPPEEQEDLSLNKEWWDSL